MNLNIFQCKNCFFTNVSVHGVRKKFLSCYCGLKLLDFNGCFMTNFHLAFVRCVNLDIHYGHIIIMISINIINIIIIINMMNYIMLTLCSILLILSVYWLWQLRCWGTRAAGCWLPGSHLYVNPGTDNTIYFARY